MNEEQLADLLTQYLDALFEGGAVPEDLPAEVADLLTVAQNLAEVAPAPRPEFGLALKESLLGPTMGGNDGSTPPASSALGGQTISVAVVALLAGVAVLVLLVSMIIFSIVGSNSSESPAPTPAQTQATESTPLPATPALTPEPAVTGQATETISTPVVTPTPIIDTLPVITVTIEIILEPPNLAPGSGGGGGGGDSSGGGGDDGGDHNRGHGNDSDHQDEDNPGKGGH